MCVEVISTKVEGCDRWVNSGEDSLKLQVSSRDIGEINKVCGIKNREIIRVNVLGNGNKSRSVGIVCLIFGDCAR